MTNQLTIQRYIKDPNVQKSIEDLLKDKARVASLTTSLITIANSNAMLAKCDPKTVLNAALKAATMNLPIEPSLGIAAIVPYGTEAQLQIMWKGYVQLAQRSREYLTISVTEVYDGQLIEEDPLHGFIFDWKAKKSDTVIGYAAYFKLINGFEKTLYMTKEQVEAHAKRFSKTYKSGKGIWTEDFDAMARKTVVKRLLDQWGPKSIELQEAILSDQSVIKDSGRVYVDNMSEEDKAVAEAVKAIEASKDEDQLTDIISSLDPEVQKQPEIVTAGQAKFREFTGGGDE